jgi:type IV pilus assembly protein PilM
VFKSDRILALDVGTSRIALGEFSTGRPGAPELLSYGIVKLGMDPDAEQDFSAYVVSAIREVMREKNIKSAPLLLCMSGQSIFPRFVKIPPVSGEKIRQIIQYEAEQNVPFPINEVVWDFQLIGGAEDGELNVLLVAAKIEHVTQLTDCVEAADFEPEIVDVAPMALYNCVRFNYPEIEGCAMVLDIGAKATNLLFSEENRIFSRSIPIGGHTITHEIAKEFEISFEEAEALKLEHAFVSFGGVYAGPENEVADRISRLTRNVITKLHAEVNRSINFYRSQQGGSTPSLVLLTGGCSRLGHIDTFFREKLKVSVEFLNPFANVPVGPNISEDEVAEDIHALAQVVGLALRRALTCPVEINLMPQELIARKTLQRRQPYFAVAAVGLGLTLLCWWGYAYRMRLLQENKLKTIKAQIESLNQEKRQLINALGKRDEEQLRTDEILRLVDLRTQWARNLTAVQDCLQEGMWLTEVTPVRTSPPTQTNEVYAVDVSVAGFHDKLQILEQQSEGTASEIFRNKLRESGQFTDETDIVKELPLSGMGYERRFTVRLDLETPIPLQGQN